jgi:hypothetical protein
VRSLSGHREAVTLTLLASITLSLAATAPSMAAPPPGAKPPHPIAATPRFVPEPPDRGFQGNRPAPNAKALVPAMPVEEVLPDADGNSHHAARVGDHAPVALDVERGAGRQGPAVDAVVGDRAAGAGSPTVTRSPGGSWLSSGVST